MVHADAASDDPPNGQLTTVRRMHPGGWPRYRMQTRFDRAVQRVRDAWWCLTGKHSLHRAWQIGYDCRIMDESQRRARIAFPSDQKMPPYHFQTLSNESGALSYGAQSPAPKDTRS